MQGTNRYTLMAAGLAIGLAGCGLGLSDNPPGGTDNLPTSAIGPYVRPADAFETPNQEPWILSDNQADLSEPWIVARDDGGFRIWYARQVTGQAAPRELWYAEFADYGHAPDVAPRRVLAPTSAWEETTLSAPSVFDDGNRLLMVYAGGDDLASIGLATSMDDGATWQAADAPILTGVRSPSVAVVGEELWMVAERVGMPGIWRAKASLADPTSWTFDAAAIATARPELEEAFDKAVVGSPAIVARETVAGRLRVGVWFTGLKDAANGDTASVGYIGTFDGVLWERYSPTNSVLAAPGREPSLIVGPRSGLMAFSAQRSARSGIAIAVHPAP